MLKANPKAGIRETLIIGLKQTTALYHTKETAANRPLRASMANVGESLDLLALYGGLDPATKGKPEDWVVLDYLP
jgi:NitT/TauT family transport system substrate-binding protein